MTKTLKILNVTICCPGDVEREIVIAREVIDAWNQQNQEATGLYLKARHWSTDCAPTMEERGQAAINRQMIDESHMLIAIFWTRLGTPTGLAGSGTEEEISRAMARDIRVMAYFSRLEAPHIATDSDQVKKLEAFQGRMRDTGFTAAFNSRHEFRKLLGNHLEIAVQDISAKSKKLKKRPSKKGDVSQTAAGDGNIQSAGDKNVFNINVPKKPIITVERHPDHISPADQKRVTDWIYALADASTGDEVGKLRASWWSRLHNKFDVPRYELLRNDQMPLVKFWYEQQLNILKQGRKTTDPEQWRKDTYGKIKGMMKKMGKADDDYYQELSDRLNMKKPFKSLTKLSKHDLSRAEGMVRRDFKKWGAS